MFMVRVYYFILFLFYCSSGYGQKNTFTIKTPDGLGGRRIQFQNDSIPIDTTIGFYKVWINKTRIFPDSIGQKVKTNYPDFDTILYGGTEIISRFKPNEKYVFVEACCLSIDILPEEKGNPFNKGMHTGDFDEARFDSLRALYYDDRTGVRFKPVKGKSQNHFGYFCEDSGWPYIILLKNVKRKHFYYPQKGWFRTNFTAVGFGVLNDSIRMQGFDSLWQNNPDIVEDIYLMGRFMEATITYRFFHDENIELEYEPRTKKIEIKIIE